MDQKKIGLFIAKMRKEKKLTQQELADKLNVTDRAVSNWERGLRMPDVSFFKPLGDLLGFTVNELINGEKMSKEDIIIASDNHLIKTISKNRQNKRKFLSLILVVFLLIVSLIISLFIYYQKTYPKIGIYNINVIPSDPDIPYVVNKKFALANFDVYYYGIDSAGLCDTKENCYGLASAFDHHQVTINELQKHLESQMLLGNVERYMLYDGGTTIYNAPGYSVIFCNTTEGNKDLYIGVSDMADSLEGAYCGHDKNPLVTFKRTYTILSSQLTKDAEFIKVSLKQNNGDQGSAIIHKSFLLSVGHTYEFTFYTFDQFADTIENIFKYSTLLEINETTESEYYHINDEIKVNKQIGTGAELNEVKEISMQIKEGTLTNTGATVVITDLSGGRYIHGAWYRVDKKENGIWQEVQNICDNCAFEMMAYGPDKNGKIEMNCHWSLMYGELENGEYRIVKGALPELDRATTIEDEKYYSVEFEIK